MPHHRNDFGPWNVERTDGRLAAEEMAAATARKFFIVEESFLEWRKDPEHMRPITRWKTSSRSLRSNNAAPKGYSGTLRLRGWQGTAPLASDRSVSFRSRAEPLLPRRDRSGIRGSLPSAKPADSEAKIPKD